ncbi:MAG: sulfite exporter TauE/SafE family protein [Rhodospirillaceae bacterium]|jgi:uncharacterized protein|nr:sulfite exporter TauE/SafE family protein [Rhodospirillaceae bacterium]MBT7768939.1 sulfite exporter TauE/SafE family protein [Rhodospirillales bacterium]MBT4700814.1 sulfite exporter TauE/SafE family protein [Rhodospirillaceae bacterium]MBT5036850.1 sulfite exporter TauE/SafE family protein [Rhodospirillaceae bacterium]MBT6219543.1 sulfite exporter TauE/SafE family protein [Rhodospirillaceae bacterium]
MTEFSFGIEMALAVAIVTAGGIIRGYTGFGTGLVMAPLFTLLWGPVEAVATTVALGTISTVQLTLPALPLVKWREVGPLIAGVLLVAPFGTHLLLTVDPGVIKQVIAAAVLFFALIMLCGWKYKGPRGVGPSIATGCIGGFFNGIAAVGGGVLVLYLMSLPDNMRTQRANIVIAVGVLPLIVFLTIAISGAMTQQIFLNVAILVVPALLSVWAGSRLFGFLPERAFRLTVLWTLIIISGAMLVA